MPAPSPYFDRTYFSPTYFDTDSAPASGHGGRSYSPNPVRRRQQRINRSNPIARLAVGIQDDEDLFGGMT